MKEKVISFLQDCVLGDATLDDLDNFEIYARKQSDVKTYEESFVDFFELGNWLNEAIRMNDIDIVGLIDESKAAKEAEYLQAASEMDQIEVDYRRMQGWLS